MYGRVLRPQAKKGLPGSHFTRGREEERNEEKKVNEVDRNDETTLGERQQREDERRGEERKGLILGSSRRSRGGATRHMNTASQ